MGEQILLSEEFQIIYVNTIPFRRNHLIPCPTPCLECRMYLLTFFQRTEYGKKKKKSNLTVEYPGKHHLGQVITVNTSVLSHVASMCPWYEWWEGYFNSVVFFLKIQKPSLTRRKKKKKIRKSQIEGHSTKYLTGISQILMKNKERLENYHRPEETKEPKEIWQLDVMWCPRWDLGTKKGQVEKREIQIVSGIS